MFAQFCLRWEIFEAVWLICSATWGSFVKCNNFTKYIWPIHSFVVATAMTKHDGLFYAIHIWQDKWNIYGVHSGDKTSALLHFATAKRSTFHLIIIHTIHTKTSTESLHDIILLTCVNWKSNQQTSKNDSELKIEKHAGINGKTQIPRVMCGGREHKVNVIKNFMWQSMLIFINSTFFASFESNAIVIT